jgi:hypothetical protein
MTNKNTIDDAPEGFISHLLDTVVDATGTTEENLRAVIDETWRRARTESSTDLQTAVESYLATDALLTKKIARVKTVISNTLHKRNLSAPERFVWATGRGECRVIGFYRNSSASYQSPRYVALSHNPSAAKLLPVNTKNDFIGIRVNSKEAFIPLSWLSLSDGDLSKMVRNEIRAQESKKRQEKLSELRKQKALVETNLNKLLKELEALESQKP